MQVGLLLDRGDPIWVGYTRVEVGRGSASDIREGLVV